MVFTFDKCQRFLTLPRQRGIRIAILHLTRQFHQVVSRHHEAFTGPISTASQFVFAVRIISPARRGSNVTLLLERSHSQPLQFEKYERHSRHTLQSSFRRPPTLVVRISTVCLPTIGTIESPSAPKVGGFSSTGALTKRSRLTNRRTKPI